MNKFSKKPLLPELTVPMHNSKEAFDIDLKNSGIEDIDVRTAIRGLGKVEESMNHINQVRNATMEDHTLNERAKKAEFSKFVGKVDKQIRRDIENVSLLIDRRKDEISETVNRPISQEAGGRFAGEIRKYVSNLPSEKRVSAVKQFVDKEDFESASAVLGSKYYLAGLSEEMQQNLLDYYREKRFASLMAVNEKLDRIGKAVLHRVSILSRFKQKINSKQTQKDIAAQHAREEALTSG